MLILKPNMVYFSQVTTLLETNTVSERSESTLRKHYNQLRTSMTQGRINHCMLLAFYKEMTDKQFYYVSDEGSCLFGRFCQAKLSTNNQGNNNFCLSDFLKKTICVAQRMGPSIKYVHKIYRKSNMFYSFIRARNCTSIYDASQSN